ncbi:hypothetical protein SDC9_108274 [bioreactor metagenome]|uniref:Copper amine oxidase-like N-terminal domain-containing protein n=1 Tax=bioreactor metagenome TaxID=1076179 RepID=A0A645B8N2_9ZZZZ
MKLYQKRFTALIICVFLFIPMILTAGATDYKSINVAYDNYKIFINNNLIKPTDANGNEVSPFNYNGTIYLPLRAVSEALNRNVFWVEQQKLVVIKDSTNTYSPSKVEFTGKYAKTTYQDISVAYDSIQLFINDKYVTPTDANGAAVEPFIYNGSTFVPIRAVCVALNCTVDWKASEKAIYITDPSLPASTSSDPLSGDQVYLQNLTPSGILPEGNRSITSAVSTFNCEKEKITNGIVFENSTMVPYMQANYEIGGKFKTFSGSVATVWDSALETAYENYKSNPSLYSYPTYTAYYLYIYGDGNEIYKSKVFSFRSYPVDFSVDVTGMKTLSLKIQPETASYIEGGGTIQLPIVVIKTPLLSK